MNGDVDFKFLFSDSRARVYLLWAAITGIGFTTTQYYQDKNINFVWFALSILGFYYMYRVMPLRVKQMRHIFLSWAVPISVGLAFSIVAVRTDLLPELVGYLGSFWLLVCAVGYFWNGIYDAPSLWYYIVAGVNVAAAACAYYYEPLLIGQYIFVAIVSVWSMLMLWVFRSDSW